MCGKAYDPRFIFAWPTARYAVMSGDSAAGTLVEIKLKQLERAGKKLNEKEKEELYESVRAQGYGRKGTQALLLALEHLSNIKR